MNDKNADYSLQCLKSSVYGAVIDIVYENRFQLISFLKPFLSKRKYHVLSIKDLSSNSFDLDDLKKYLISISGNKHTLIIDDIFLLLPYFNGIESFIGFFLSLSDKFQELIYCFHSSLYEDYEQYYTNITAIHIQLFDSSKEKQFLIYIKILKHLLDQFRFKIHNTVIEGKYDLFQTSDCSGFSEIKNITNNSKAAPDEQMPTSTFNLYLKGDETAMRNTTMAPFKDAQNKLYYLPNLEEQIVDYEDFDYDSD